MGTGAAAKQHIRINVTGVEEIRDAISPHVSGALAPRSLALGVAMAGGGLERNRAGLIKADHHPINWAGAVQ